MVKVLSFSYIRIVFLLVVSFSCKNRVDGNHNEPTSPLVSKTLPQSIAQLTTQDYSVEQSSIPPNDDDSSSDERSSTSDSYHSNKHEDTPFRIKKSYFKKLLMIVDNNTVKVPSYKEKIQSNFRSLPLSS